jgi:hypothetical protein
MIIAITILALLLIWSATSVFSEGHQCDEEDIPPE